MITMTIMMIVIETIVLNTKDLLEDFLRLIRLSGVLHVNKVRIVFALFVIRERRVVADPIVTNLEIINIVILLHIARNVLV